MQLLAVVVVDAVAAAVAAVVVGAAVAAVAAAVAAVAAAVAAVAAAVAAVVAAVAAAVAVVADAVVNADPADVAVAVAAAVSVSISVAAAITAFAAISNAPTRAATLAVALAVTPAAAAVVAVVAIAPLAVKCLYTCCQVVFAEFAPTLVAKLAQARARIRKKTSAIFCQLACAELVAVVGEDPTPTPTLIHVSDLATRKREKKCERFYSWCLFRNFVSVKKS